MLSKVVSSSIFKVFGMTRPGIEPRSPGPLANTLTAGPMSITHYNHQILFPVIFFLLFPELKIHFKDQIGGQKKKYNVAVSYYIKIGISEEVFKSIENSLELVF